MMGHSRCLIAASRRVVVFSSESSPGMMDVGGLFSDFGAYVQLNNPGRRERTKRSSYGSSSSRASTPPI